MPHLPSLNAIKKSLFINSLCAQPCGTYFFCGQVFQSLGCKVVFAHIDSDREMYGYFQLNHSFEGIVAVIGFDTDFLIFDFAIYLELNSMRIIGRGLSFMGYHHHSLLHRLRCQQHHLPRIASILGCDVVAGHPHFSGDVHTAASIAKNYDDDDDSSQSSGLSKRFSLGRTFYSGVAPLDILPHPWLIMMLFQDYKEGGDCCSVTARCSGKEDDAVLELKGAIIDLSMDDLSLKRPKGVCAVMTQSVRKWLYIRLLTDDVDGEEEQKSGGRHGGTVCFENGGNSSKA